jgi:hypothetical protein
MDALKRSLAAEQGQPEKPAKSAPAKESKKPAAKAKPTTGKRVSGPEVAF